MKLRIILIGIFIVILCSFSFTTATNKTSKIQPPEIPNNTELNSELYPTDIPKRVRFSPPPESDCIIAKKLLENALWNNSEEAVGLFNDVVSVCHALWSELKTEEPFKSEPGGHIISSVDGVIVEGKAFKTKNSMNELEIYIRRKLNKNGRVIIRTPNREEMDKYWTVIAWDLDTPLFIAENNNIKIIFQFFEGYASNVVLLK